MSLAWTGPAPKCADCGGVIPAKRLAAMPNATRCVPCQALVDEPLVASPTCAANEEEVNGADFAIVSRRHGMRAWLSTGGA